jgi:hypothetical protein
MTEEELLAGITEALTLAGWRWSHHRRSDLAQMQGMPGLPDIIAVHPTRKIVLAWELKGEGGRVTGDQVAWIAGLAAPDATIDARILYPAHYDRALALIVGKTDAIVVCMMCGKPARRMLDPRSDAGLCLDCDELPA